MKDSIRRMGRHVLFTRARAVLLWLALWMMAAGVVLRAASAPAQAGIAWDGKTGLVSASIQDWSLERLLQTLTGVTGWTVYVEPGAQRTIETRFEQLPVGQALRRLLGEMNFALVPQTNGPTQLFVYQSSMANASKQVLLPKPRHSKSRDVPNELIVRLKPGAELSIDDLAKRFGGRVTGRIDKYRLYRLDFKDAASAEAARKALEAEEAVAGVEGNGIWDSPPTPGLSAYGAGSPLGLKAKPVSDGNKVIVGVIDTAIQTDGTGLKDFLLKPVSVAGASETGDGQPTHGTSVASTVLSGLSLAAPGRDSSSVRILPVDVYGTNGYTTTFHVAQGIYDAVNQGANIINLSLGSSGDSPFLHQIIQSAASQGIIFIASAGNQPTTAPMYPAAYPEVISVTAGSSSGALASYANRGSWVNAIAPGTSLFFFKDQPYLAYGTSFSAAYVSGAAAEDASNNRKSPAAIRQDILTQLGFSQGQGP